MEGGGWRRVWGEVLSGFAWGNLPKRYPKPTQNTTPNPVKINGNPRKSNEIHVNHLVDWDDHPVVPLPSVPRGSLGDCLVARLGPIWGVI